MKSNNIRKTLTAGLVILLLSGCFPDNVKVYDGPLLAEFGLGSGNPAVNYSWSSTGRFFNTEIRGTRPDTAIQIQLIGAHQKTPIQVGYYIAPEVYRNISTNRLVTVQPEGLEGTDWVRFITTAVEGDDYELLDGGVITIPANSSFGKLRISTSPTGDRMMYIVLTEMDIKPNINARIFRLRIRP